MQSLIFTISRNSVKEVFTLRSSSQSVTVTVSDTSSFDQPMLLAYLPPASRYAALIFATKLI